LLSGHADGAIGAGSDRKRLVEDDDDLAFGVPIAQIPQRLGHLMQPIAAVDDRGDFSRLAEVNEGCPPGISEPLQANARRCAARSRIRS
jgi:hypothetical protein